MLLRPLRIYLDKVTNVNRLAPEHKREGFPQRRSHRPQEAISAPKRASDHRTEYRQTSCEILG